jgi:spermidine synthase
MTLAPSRENVLILGGGDGLALREVVKYPDVRAVTLVDLDPAMTKLSREFDPIVQLNAHSFSDPRVGVINEDAFSFLNRTSDRYGVVIVDMPDPRTPDLAKLFSVEFFRLVSRHLARGGFTVVQATSPYYARDAFWSVNHSLAAAGLNVRAYHVLVPTFGDWGFQLASDLPLPNAPIRPAVPVRFADEETIARSFGFDSDTSEVPSSANTLDGDQILNYYADAWREWRGR